MRKKATVLVTLIILLISGSIQVFAASRSGQFNTLNNYLKASLEKANIPGASIMVVDKDSILYQNTYGNCKSIDDLFIIGSMSKSFTALSIMQLSEQKELELDSPIIRYLPEAAYGDEITVRQLLNQTSGIGAYAKLDNYRITAKKGTHVYGNANYGLLGEIIEKVSGCSYADYIKDNIFSLAGMNHSYTSLDKAKENGMIGGYRNYFGFSIKEQMPYPAPDSKGWITIPAGYIISSASDMGRYLQVYLNNGKNIISGKSIHSMFFNKVRVIDDVYYGMGWGSLDNYSEPVIYHGGLVENYSSVMYLLPDSGIGICLLTNANDYLVANNIMSQVYLEILNIIMGEEPGQLKGNLYILKHLFIDGIYLSLVILSMLPLLRIKRWNKRWDDAKSFRRVIGFIGVHIIIPSAILMLTFITGLPIEVVKAFVPDLYIILCLSVVLLYGTGIIKLFLRISI